MRGARLLATLLAVAVLTLHSWTRSAFVALEPGLVRPAGDLGAIAGAPPSEERLLYTAVVARKASVIDGLRSLFDRRVRLAPRSESIPGGVGWRTYSRMLDRSMAESQKIAAAVAFREAGHRVPVQTAVIVEAALPKSAFWGLIPEGSRLASVDRIPVATAREAYDLLRAADANGVVRLAIQPPDSKAERYVEGGAGSPNGEDATRPFGLLLATVHEFAYPVHFEMGEADAGGSSAGLMLALELYDQLTGGGLAGNRLIAGTGALRLDGAVDPVDGVPQKIVAAKRSRAEVFILPRENLKDALGVADGILLVPVDTFAEALDALRRFRGEE